MLVANFVTNHAAMSDTRTYEELSKFIGSEPHKLGLLTRLYPELTATYLTESLRNVFYNDGGSKNRFQSSDSLYFEWEVETNNIKRIPFAAVPSETGENGTEIVMAFTERYFEKYDIFKIDNSGQQCFVVARPVRKSDDYWEVTVRLIDNDYKSVLDVSACQPGMTARFQSNAHPELHQEGYIKYQSNISKHRNYITTFRNDDSWSALYAAHEDTFISIGKGEGNGKMKETIYRMDKKEKVLLDNFLYARNNGLLFNRTSMDVNGKSTIVDPSSGRPIIIGDGIIPQVERFASKYAFSKLTINVFHTVLAMLNEKAKSPTGNHYVFICNERMWFLIQQTLLQYLANFHDVGTKFYSMKANGNVEVGPDAFDTYKYGGNSISFKVDRTFSREYGYRTGYALCLDLTSDATSSMPPIAMMSLKGKDIIHNKINGVGGYNGMTSGEVSSPVAGSQAVIWGYAGVLVANPYRSFILRELDNDI
jgi:hypothetical protein